MLDNATHGRSPAQKLWFHFKLRRVQVITTPEIYIATKKCCFVKAELLAEHHMYDMNMETLHIVRHKSGGQAEAKSLWGVE